MLNLLSATNVLSSVSDEVPLSYTTKKYTALRSITRYCRLFYFFCWFRLMAWIPILLLFHSNLSKVIMTEFYM